MNILLIIGLLLLCLRGSLVGRKASEQFFPHILNWLKQQQQFVDQKETYNVLVKMIRNSDISIQKSVEYSCFVNEIQSELQQFSDLILKLKEQLKDDTTNYISEELKLNIGYFDNIIKEKKKLVEQDIREIEKMKANQKNHSKQLNKLDEIDQLLIQIDYDGFSNTNQEKIYKLLELIEAKIIIGLFPQKELQEIQQYMKIVNQLFKSNNFDQVQIYNSLSLIRNVLNDIKINLLIKLQQDEMEELEALSVFQNSKITHSNASEYFLKEKEQFLIPILKNWNEIMLNLDQEIQDDKEYQLLFSQLQLSISKNFDDEIIAKQNNKYSIKRMETQYLTNQF